MKKNNKGFTLIELLAVLVLLGVLGTIGVTATMKYLTQSRQKSYRIMSQTIYEAYENCAIQGKCSLPTSGSKIVNYNIKKLLDMGYLENLTNPNTNKEDCSGTMNIEAGTDVSSSGYIKYTYEVSLECPGMETKVYTWPDEKQNK